MLKVFVKWKRGDVVTYTDVESFDYGQNLIKLRFKDRTVFISVFNTEAVDIKRQDDHDKKGG